MIRARIDFADGHHENYRLVPSAAMELPLQPLPATNGALLGYVQAKQGQGTTSGNSGHNASGDTAAVKAQGKGSTPPLSRFYDSVDLTLQGPTGSP